MSNTVFILLLTVAFITLLGGVIFLIASPIKSKNRMVASNNLDPSLNKLLKMFGGDFEALIPDNLLYKKVQYSRLQKLFKLSNNPWKLSYTEFILLQFILGFVGIIVGVGVFVFATYFLKMLTVGVILLVVIPFIFFTYPINYYRGVAKDRELKFKAQLPEAIDYLVMALSGGGFSLQTAFEETISYLEPSIIREEFELIVNDLNSGHSMESAINKFAERSPTDGLRAFAKSVNNASKLSVSLVEILQNRALESRRDLENEIDKRIATLESKVVLAFSMPTAFSLGIVVVAPALYTLSQAL